MERRIHILGASGAGTTTLGRALSERFAIPHFDTDNYHWDKSDIPFTVKRGDRERAKLLKDDLLRNPEWVLSGSLCDWGDFTIPMFTLVVFIWIPHDLRMERIKTREAKRYGLEAISPGGWFYEHHQEFLAYASAYDSAGLEVDIRSKKLHEQWMKRLPCRLLRIETPLPIQKMTEIVEKEISEISNDGNV